MARANLQAGLELDGNTVRAVIYDVKTNKVYGTAVYAGATLLDAFAQWEKSKSNVGQALAVWSGPDTQYAITDIPELPPAAMPAAIQAAAADQFVITGDGIHSGGRRGSRDEVSKLYRLAVAGVETEAISRDLWKALDHANVKLTMPGLLIRQDGVYLGIHGSNTQITVVVGGIGVFSRALRVGGVEHLVALALDPDPLAKGRLNDAANEYIADLEKELSSSIAFATTQYDVLPNRVWVHGPGSVVPGIVSKLGTQSGYEVIIPEPSATIDMSDVATSSVGSHFMSLIAASTDLEEAPYVGTPNPYRIEKDAKHAEQARKSRRLTVMVGSIVGVFAIVAALIYPAMKAKSDAESDRQSALDTLAGLVEADTTAQLLSLGSAAWTEVTKEDTDWSALITALEGTAPPGTEFRTIKLSRSEDGRIVAAIEADVVAVDGLPRIAEWIVALEELGASNILPTSVGQDQGTAQVALSLTLTETDAFPVTRPAPGDEAPSTAVPEATP